MRKHPSASESRNLLLVLRGGAQMLSAAWAAFNLELHWLKDPGMLFMVVQEALPLQRTRTCMKPTRSS